MSTTAAMVCYLLTKHLLYTIHTAVLALVEQLHVKLQATSTSISNADTIQTVDCSVTNELNVRAGLFSVKSDKIRLQLPTDITKLVTLTNQLTIQGSKLDVMKNQGSYSNKIDVENGLIKVSIQISNNTLSFP